MKQLLACLIPTCRIDLTGVRVHTICVRIDACRVLRRAQQQSFSAKDLQENNQFLPICFEHTCASRL